jgi:hypothetical protein
MTNPSEVYRTLFQDLLVIIWKYIWKSVEKENLMVYYILNKLSAYLHTRQ